MQNSAIPQFSRHWLLLGLTALSLALLTTATNAETAENAEKTAATSAPPVLVIPQAARATPDFDVEEATAAYLALISPDLRARSDAYFEGGYWLTLWDWVWSLGVAVLLLARARTRRLSDWIQSRVRWRMLADFLTVALLIVLGALLTFPLTLWAGYFREHAYGLSNQTLGAFLFDWTKEIGIGLVLGAPVLTVLYLLVRKWPRTWWVGAAAVSILFMIFAMTIAPVYIEPLFNDYQKLEPGPLRDEILSMARSHRIPADDVFWFDASRQTQRISANVSGFAGTLRIALNDNLLRSPS